jgi:hypothetical protein
MKGEIGDVTNKKRTFTKIITLRHEGIFARGKRMRDDKLD